VLDGGGGREGQALGIQWHIAPKADNATIYNPNSHSPTAKRSLHKHSNIVIYVGP
jgi:hypothetical protein